MKIVICVLYRGKTFTESYELSEIVLYYITRSCVLYMRIESRVRCVEIVVRKQFL